VAAGDLLPDLLLALMIVRHRERHQLFKRHVVARVDVEQFLGDCRELQPLLNDGGAQEKSRGDVGGRSRSGCFRGARFRGARFLAVASASSSLRAEQSRISV
jgi:hypothetical protein